MQPVFIHSSWRTSSTWIWQQFRYLPETLCYYEPFHEDLSSMSRQTALEMDVESWTSGHARTAPYFLEYAPLLRKAGGVRLHEAPFPYDWFIPQGGLTGTLRRAEIRYFSLLIRHAEKMGKTPVLGCVRSLGRIAPLKETFGGTHLFLLRNLWGQWMSFIDQRRRGNNWFYNKLRIIANQAEDRFLTDIHNFYFRRCVELAAEHKVLPQLGGLTAQQFTKIIFDLLPEGEMFEMFMGVHLYLYLHAFFVADIALDSTEMTRNEDYRRQCEKQVREATGLMVDFSGGKQPTQRAEMVNGAFDWQRIRQHATLAVASLQDIHDRTILERLADKLITATIAEAGA